MSNDCSSELPCAGKENNANLLNALPRKTKLKPPFGLPDSALIELSKRNHKLRLQQCEESIPTFCDWKKSDNGPQILLDIPKAAVYRDKVERKLSVRIHKQQPMIPKHNRQLKKFFELETCRLKRADSAKKE